MRGKGYLRKPERVDEFFQQGFAGMGGIRFSGSMGKSTQIIRYESQCGLNAVHRQQRRKLTPNLD